VDATDDGAVFVIGQPPFGSWKAGGLTIPNGPAAVWFTDGSAPVRIGTTIGDRPRGFEIAPTTEGSTLAWTDPGSTTRPGQIVVYDTARMSEVARFGNADAEPLAVYPDVVYWSPAGTNCSTYPSGWWGRAPCQGTGPVMRFDTTSGQQTPVGRADYLADRRARPGLLTEAHDHGRGSLFLDFKRRGDRLVADGGAPTVVLTGQPLRLRMPADDRTPHRLTLTQWLDPDRVVLVGTDARDGTISSSVGSPPAAARWRSAFLTPTPPSPRRGRQSVTADRIRTVPEPTTQKCPYRTCSAAGAPTNGTRHYRSQSHARSRRRAMVARTAMNMQANGSLLA
jgi:hypothetical protein